MSRAMAELRFRLDIERWLCTTPSTSTSSRRQLYVSCPWLFVPSSKHSLGCLRNVLRPVSPETNISKPVHIPLRALFQTFDPTLSGICSVPTLRRDKIGKPATLFINHSGPCSKLLTQHFWESVQTRPCEEMTSVWCLTTQGPGPNF